MKEKERNYKNKSKNLLKLFKNKKKNKCIININD